MSDARYRAGDPRPAEQADGSYDRLDALSRPLAERVLQRAIALHHDDLHRPDRISRTTLEEIASELGVAPEYVRRALAEELEPNYDAPKSLRERILAPDRVTGGRVVQLSPDDAKASIVAWMGGQEGLRPRARVAEGVKWEKDSHWSTSLRLGLGGSEATGALRNLPSVTHRQTAVSPTDQLIEIDADTRIISQVAAGVGGGLAGAGLVGGIVTAAAMAGGSDVAQFLGPFAPALVLGISTGLIIAKSWLTAVRRGIDRALDGIANPSMQRRKSRRRKSGVVRVLDEVRDALDDLL